MLQASFFDCYAFDLFSFSQDFYAASEVDVSRREIIQALVIATMIVVIDEGTDLRLQVARQIIVLEQDAVLEDLMPALDLALRLRELCWIFGIFGDGVGPFIACDFDAVAECYAADDLRQLVLSLQSSLAFRRRQ